MKKANTNHNLHADCIDFNKLAHKYGIARKRLDYILDVAQKSMKPIPKRIAITEFN